MKQKIKQDVNIGKNIRRLRNAQRLTQDQLACKLQLLGCDVTRGALAKMEAGIQNIYVSELKALIIALNTDYDSLFE